MSKLLNTPPSDMGEIGRLQGKISTWRLFASLEGLTGLFESIDRKASN